MKFVETLALSPGFFEKENKGGQLPELARLLILDINADMKRTIKIPKNLFMVDDL